MPNEAAIGPNRSSITASEPSDTPAAEGRPAAAAKLSALQRRILLAVYHAELRDTRGYHTARGIPLREIGRHPGWRGHCRRRPRAESAAFSRALKRLEDRGLLRRRNCVNGDRSEGPLSPEQAEKNRRLGWKDCVPGPQPVPENHKTTGIQLTEAGRQVARWLDVDGYKRLTRSDV